MKNQKKDISIKDILKGKFLVEQGAPKAWRFLLFLLFLAFLSIYSSHLVDKKVVKIRQTKDSVREYNSESTYVHQKLMKQKMLLEVEKSIVGSGLTKPDKRLMKIIKPTWDE
jgi:Bacteriodetes cell division protein (FtsL-like)